MLFTQLPDEVDSMACWRGTWAPLADINGRWHDGRTRNTSGSASRELFCLERGFQLGGEFESLSDKVIVVGDDSVNVDFKEVDADKVPLSGAVTGLGLDVVHDMHIKTNSKLLHAGQLP